MNIEERRETLTLAEKTVNSNIKGLQRMLRNLKKNQVVSATAFEAIDFFQSEGCLNKYNLSIAVLNKRIIDWLEVLDLSTLRVYKRVKSRSNKIYTLSLKQLRDTRNRWTKLLGRHLRAIKSDISIAKKLEREYDKWLGSVNFEVTDIMRGSLETALFPPSFQAEKIEIITAKWLLTDKATPARASQKLYNLAYITSKTLRGEIKQWVKEFQLTAERLKKEYEADLGNVTTAELRSDITEILNTIDVLELRLRDVRIEKRALGLPSYARFLRVLKDARKEEDYAALENAIVEEKSKIEQKKAEKKRFIEKRKSVKEALLKILKTEKSPYLFI